MSGDDYRQRMLRLFLSVDLTGSSRYKGSNPVMASTASETYPKYWGDVFVDFFEDFSRELFDKDRDAIKGSGRPFNPLRIWKINGDEILFVSELDSKDQLLTQELLAKLKV